MALRGGSRQKTLQLRDLERAQASTGSHLARLLLTKRSWGIISTALVQDVAFAAVQDGTQCEQLKVLAGLGSSGAHPQNFDRDLNIHLMPTPMLQCLQTFSVPLKASAFNFVTVDTNILYPHVVFAKLYQHHPSCFMHLLCGGSVQRVSDFWSQVHDHPAVVDHPCKGRADWQTRTIPIAPHGDGVPVEGCGKS